MNYDYFRQSKFLLQIILDGYGVGKKDHTNAIYKASTPYMDYLLRNYANTQLFAHGSFVGLANTDLGGSEVGHSTIGAGNIRVQLPVRIQKMIQDGSFENSACLQKTFAVARGGALHLIGLLSDGNIHSHIKHVITIIRLAVKNNITRCYLHALLDGRDTAIQSALHYTEQIENLFTKINKEHQNFHYAFASAGGREYTTMDRAQNWQLISRGWELHIKGVAEFSFASVKDGIEYFRQKNSKIIDQDIPAFTIYTNKQKTIAVKDEDAVFFFNFRADRALEFSSIWYDKNFNYFDLKGKPRAFFAAMTVYDQEKSEPKNRIIEPLPKILCFGERLVEKGMRQFRISETQKYPHVTFFYNGGYAVELDKNLETYYQIESNLPDSFASMPQMKAVEITEKTIDLISSGDYRFGLVNFPNPDMVGHTGNFLAAVEAIEVVDSCLQRICETAKEKGGIVIVTADHGNADEMIELVDSKEQISTKHSLNPVPFVIVDKNFQARYQLQQNSFTKPLGLSQIAATSFILLGEQEPMEMQTSLFQKT